MYRWEFTAKSLKEIKKLDDKVQKRIITKLDYYCSGNPLLHAERLIDFKIGEYRFRIGDYRAIFDLKGDMLIIHKVGHRKNIYR